MYLCLRRPRFVYLVLLLLLYMIVCTHMNMTISTWYVRASSRYHDVTASSEMASAIGNPREEFGGRSDSADDDLDLQRFRQERETWLHLYSGCVRGFWRCLKSTTRPYPSLTIPLIRTLERFHLRIFQKQKTNKKITCATRVISKPDSGKKAESTPVRKRL